MTAVESTMLALGTAAPSFQLPDTSREIRSLESIAEGADAVVVAFICNHCPYVKLIADRFASLADELIAKRVAVVAINSNDADSYPDDAPEAMAEEAGLRGYRFPYLYDESQQVALSYRAACTPDFYVFDRDLRLTYRGRFDAARPGNGEAVTGADLREAVEAALAGQPPIATQLPSIGCNIKWRPGVSPEWFS
ncbi:MAG: thioredoxin family protein [Solirubrobacterales bacterium]|nr:thioredoxin family protein [Solirubrobacterales bacterium]